MPATTPEPDEFGRYRVTDKDTGHKISIFASQLAHGNFTVLKQPASDIAGDALPPEYDAVKPTSSSTPTSGPAADPKKETTNG